MKKALFFVATIALVACSPKQDAAFFENNEAERIAKIAECTSGIKSPADVKAFESNAVCVAALMAEPYQMPDFWRENLPQFTERLTLCKAVGVELKGSSTCQSVFKTVTANMGGGTPVQATFDPGVFK